MISVIICNIDPAKFAAVQAMYAAAMGDEPWEIIGIHDARGSAAAYNRSVIRSRGDILIFSHDDLEVLNPRFPQRLREHLARFDIVGVAGTSRIINGGWPSAGPPHIFGQVAQLQADGRILVNIYGAPRPIVGNIQAVDGLFIAVRRAVMDQIPFDAVTFDGFHVYDMDFGLRAYRAGLRIGVACDINLLHCGGNYDDAWRIYVDRFHRKWFAQTPPGSMPKCQWATVIVESREQALEVMNPRYWEDQTDRP